MNITTEQLISLGFIDVDGLGITLRKSLPDGLLEIGLFRQIDPHFLRLQTIKSGITTRLKGVQTLDDLCTFWKLKTGNELISEWWKLPKIDNPGWVIERLSDTKPSWLLNINYEINVSSDGIKIDSLEIDIKKSHAYSSEIEALKRMEQNNHIPKFRINYINTLQ